MSERGRGWGTKRKRTKSLHDVQQEAEEKATDASKEGNAWGSTPTESKLGVSSERANQELQGTTASSTKVGEFKRGKFLFELQLTPLDVKKGRLLIPAEQAADYFPSLRTTRQGNKEELQISDTRNQNWYMKIVYNVNKHAFIITEGWQEFVVSHNLHIMDVICFYRPLPCSHNKHFLIEHVKPEEDETNDIHEFKQENFLFQLQLTRGDITFGRLIIPGEEVKNHFPAIQIPAAAHKWERLKLTDAQNKDWWVKIRFSTDVDAYVIIKGWERFVEEHNLKAMDVIKFYKPVLPSHTRHFLIDYEEREEAGTNPTQSSSPRNDGNCEGPIHGGSYKGKEVAVGYEKPAP